MANAQFLQLGPYSSSGATVTSPKLYHYAAGTSTDKNIWSDRGEITTLAQPFIGDANGVFNFFADGLYKFVIKDSSDNTLYTLDNILIKDFSAPTFAEGSSIPSASTTVLGSEIWAHITGTTDIDALDGTIPFFWAVFDGTLTLQHSSNLLLFNSVDFKVQSGSVVLFLNEGSGIWRQASACPPTKQPDIASASSITAPSDASFVDITGTTTITAVASANAGHTFRARFTGAGLNLIHDTTTFQCPFETDYRTSLNEVLEFISLGSGNWLVVQLSGAPHLEPGTPFQWWGTTAPKGAVLCDATALNCTTYHGLARRLVPSASTLGNVGTSVGTFTADAGTDVITLTTHGLAVNDMIHVTTSAADLPLNLVINTVYFVKTVPTADTLTLSATRGGATFDIGDAGTGTHTLHNKVNAPDVRGRAWIGIDGSANRITSASTNGGNADTLGGVGGTETHTLSTSELSAHAHPNWHFVGAASGTGQISMATAGNDVDAATSATGADAGGGGAHSNTQPWIAGGSVIRF